MNGGLGLRRWRDGWRGFGRRHALPRFIIVNWALGAATGLMCVALLLALDPVGLRPLLFASDSALVALFLLCGGFAVTFGGVVAATAVMLSVRGDDGAGGARRGVRPGIALARVSAGARRRSTRPDGRAGG